MHFIPNEIILDIETVGSVGPQPHLYKVTPNGERIDLKSGNEINKGGRLFIDEWVKSSDVSIDFYYDGDDEWDEEIVWPEMEMIEENKGS